MAKASVAVEELEEKVRVHPVAYSVSIGGCTAETAETEYVRTERTLQNVSLSEETETVKSEVQL